MKIRKDVPHQTKGQAMAPHGSQKYDWSSIEIGDSVHAENIDQARAMVASFKHSKWKGNHTGMKTMRRKVGKTDPDGEGWRIWIIEAPEDFAQSPSDGVW